MTHLTNNKFSTKQINLYELGGCPLHQKEVLDFSSAEFLPKLRGHQIKMNLTLHELHVTTPTKLVKMYI